MCLRWTRSRARDAVAGQHNEPDPRDPRPLLMPTAAGCWRPPPPRRRGGSDWAITVPAGRSNARRILETAGRGADFLRSPPERSDHSLGLTMARPDLVIFDVDGVLVDSEAISSRLLAST